MLPLLNTWRVSFNMPDNRNFLGPYLLTRNSSSKAHPMKNQDLFFPKKWQLLPGECVCLLDPLSLYPHLILFVERFIHMFNQQQTQRISSGLGGAGIIL